MPRKEGPPLEERMQRAKELFEQKQRQKQKNLQELYASRIYKLARKTSILFLWIAQFILIDWALPFQGESDKITGGYFNSASIPDKGGLNGFTYYRLTQLSIKTEKGRDFITDFPEEAAEPALGDSIIIYKSLLLHDFKKLEVPRIKESYLITSAITYHFLPALLMISALAAMFIFIKNIEIKSFAWLVFISTATGGIFLIVYLAASFL
jgi:hypothetical protein